MNPATDSSLVIGIDVGGTNTDAVLLDTTRTGPEAIVSWHKTPTEANITLGLKNTLQGLLEKAPRTSRNIAAVTIGTTHFVNAILEHDASRLEKVAVIRLASYGFTGQTPSFVDWPPMLRRLLQGHAAIVPGGVNIDGSRITDLDPTTLVEEAEIIRSKKLKNVVIVGVGSPMDTKFDQESRARDILRERLSDGDGDDDNVNLVCSRDIAGSGILTRENASILNASIINFARRTIQGFARALTDLGFKKCPLYLTSNTGHLLSFADAIQFPIRVFSSGPANSLRGAAYLAKRYLGTEGAIVVDIGGTTSDVGYLLRNGYPRLTTSYTEIAGIKVNLEVLQVDSIALGGGSLLHVSWDGKHQVRVGPDSVGYELTAKSLCFGGSTPTATDVAVATDRATIGTTKPNLPRDTAEKATVRIRTMLEGLVDRVKTSPEPCTVILVGGGAPLCLGQLDGVREVVCPEYAAVANAVGAAIAQIGGRAERTTDSASVESVKSQLKREALADAYLRGGVASATVITKEEVTGVPYTPDTKNVYMEVACPADHARFYSTFESSGQEQYGYGDTDEGTCEHPKHVNQKNTTSQDAEKSKADLTNYRPAVTESGQWILSKTDLEFLAVGCYILGCGGGGSPYGTYLQLVNLVEEGHPLVIVDSAFLEADAVLAPVAGVGSPAVANERPGGNLVLHSLQAMEKEIGKQYQGIMAVEVGGSNGLQPLIWGSSKYYGIPCVDGDFMGRAYPHFEQMTNFIKTNDVNDLLPVSLSSGTGRDVIIPANQPDLLTAKTKIRDVCVEMGAAAGATGRPLNMEQIRDFGILSSHSLAWRLGRAVILARQQSRLHNVSQDIIREFGGERSARVICRGKIMSVEHNLTMTAHTTGKVVLQQLSADDVDDGSNVESDVETATDGLPRIMVEFINENLRVKTISDNNDDNNNHNISEECLAIVPDLIFLLDMATGEAIGTPEYRYGLKVIVMAAAPHSLWTTERGLEIGGPAGFGMTDRYTSSLVYAKPRSVIEEFRGSAQS